MLLGLLWPGLARAERKLSNYELRYGPERQIAPLLRRYLADYAATGLPPAYLPHDPDHDSPDDDSGDPT